MLDDPFLHHRRQRLTTLVEEMPAAQPAGTVGAQAPASTGTTEIDGGGKFAAATTADPAAPVDDNELELSAGGLLSTGNARAGSRTAARGEKAVLHGPENQHALRRARSA